MTSTLYYGHNLDNQHCHVKDESVDLVHFDPPFNSAQDYNVLFAEQDGDREAAQIQAFEERWDEAAEAADHEPVTAGGPVSVVLQGFRQIHGTNGMLAFLTMMSPRLQELHRHRRRRAWDVRHAPGRLSADPAALGRESARRQADPVPARHRGQQDGEASTEGEGGPRRGAQPVRRGR